MGNPFLDEFDELISLDSRNCMDDSVATPLRTLEETGTNQYREYIKNVIEIQFIPQLKKSACSF